MGVDSDAGTGVDVGVVVDMNDLPAPNAPSKVVEGTLDVELETGAAFVKEKPVKEVDGAAGNEDRFIVAPALEAVVDAAFPVVVVVVAEDEEKLNPNLDCEDVAVSNLSLSNLSLLLAPMKSAKFLGISRFTHRLLMAILFNNLSAVSNIILYTFCP